MCKSRAFFSLESDSMIPEIPGDKKPFIVSEETKQRWNKIIKTCKNFDDYAKKLVSKAKSVDEKVALFNFLISTKRGKKLFNSAYARSMSRTKMREKRNCGISEDEGEALIEYGCIDVEYSPT